MDIVINKFSSLKRQSIYLQLNKAYASLQKKRDENIELSFLFAQ